MEWLIAIEGHNWVHNYNVDIPDSQKGSIQHQGNGLYTVRDGNKVNVIPDLVAERVPEALQQLGIANMGWE